MNEIKLKDAVRRRDGYRCVECGLTDQQHVERYGRRLEVHRLVPGSVYSIEGTVTLCKTCHGPKPKKFRRPRVGKTRSLVLRGDLVAALDAFRATLRPAVTRGSVIEVAVEDFLCTKGFRPAAPLPAR